MTAATDILIAGSGPTGLASAIFLTAFDRTVKIIDKASEPAATSRAQVINPRTLELLEPSGVTATLLQAGRPLHGVRFYDGWDYLAGLNFGDLHPRFPMLTLPQAMCPSHSTACRVAAAWARLRGNQTFTSAIALRKKKLLVASPLSAMQHISIRQSPHAA
jgi:hypothetical protein